MHCIFLFCFRSPVSFFFASHNTDYGCFPKVRTASRTCHSIWMLFKCFPWTHAYHLGIDWSGKTVLIKNEILIMTSIVWVASSDDWKAFEVSTYPLQCTLRTTTKPINVFLSFLKPLKKKGSCIHVFSSALLGILQLESSRVLLHLLYYWD